MALDAYHRELSKLNAQCPTVGSSNLPGILALQQQALNQQVVVMSGQQNGMAAQDLSLPKMERKGDMKLPNGETGMETDCKKESMVQGMDSVAEALRHAGSAFSLVRPKAEPGTKIPN